MCIRVSLKRSAPGREGPLCLHGHGWCKILDCFLIRLNFQFMGANVVCTLYLKVRNGLFEGAFKMSVLACSVITTPLILWARYRGPRGIASGLTVEVAGGSGSGRLRSDTDEKEEHGSAVEEFEPDAAGGGEEIELNIR